MSETAESDDGQGPRIDLKKFGLQTPKSGVKASQLAKDRIKERIRLALALKPIVPIPEASQDDNFTRATADVILVLCQSLRLSLGTLLSSLAYLQLYRRSSEKWGYACTDYGATSEGNFVKYSRDEQFLTASACVLLAWKTLEDTLEPSRCGRKLFELLSALYKMSSGGSVSSWMLHDGSQVSLMLVDYALLQEAKTLKTLVIEYETRLLHAIEYAVGPLALPHVLLQSLARRFAALLWPNVHLKQHECEVIERGAGVLLVECFKCALCLDYGPHELACACIVKAACILVAQEPDANELETLDRLQGPVLKLLSIANVKASVLSQLLFQLETLPFTASSSSPLPLYSSIDKANTDKGTASDA